MRVTESHVFGVLANNLQRSRARLLDLQQQVSTGKAVRRPSDDPSAFHQVLHHRVSLVGLDQDRKSVV